MGEKNRSRSWKKSIFGIVACLMLSIAISGCVKMSEPPDMTAERANGEKMTLIRGTYSWENVESDSGMPTEQLRDEDVHKFQPQGSIRLVFEGEEPFQVKANLISMEDPQATPINVIVRGTTLILPDLPGDYALQIWSIWGNQDYASYALSVRIEEP